MIGLEQIGIGVSLPIESGVYYEDHLSLNLITGAAIKTHLESKNIKPWTKNANFKPYWREFKLLPPITTKERRFRVQLTRQWTIDDIQIGATDFYEWLFSSVRDTNK